MKEAEYVREVADFLTSLGMQINEKNSGVTQITFKDTDTIVTNHDSKNNFWILVKFNYKNRHKIRNDLFEKNKDRFFKKIKESVLAEIECIKECQIRNAKIKKDNEEAKIIIEKTFPGIPFFNHEKVHDGQREGDIYFEVKIGEFNYAIYFSKETDIVKMPFIMKGLIFSVEEATNLIKMLLQKAAISNI